MKTLQQQSTQNITRSSKQYSGKGGFGQHLIGWPFVVGLLIASMFSVAVASAGYSQDESTAESKAENKTESKVAEAQAERAVVVPPIEPINSVFYLDCSHLVFDNFFDQELTRAERVNLLNANIEANVGNYEACRNAANESAQERMVNAGSLDSVGSGADAPSELPEDLELDSEEEDTRPPASASRSHSGGSGSGGTSTVCDAIKQGLAGAKTESEKAHFQKLKNDYGCQ